MTKSNYWKAIANDLCIADFFARNCQEEIDGVSYDEFLSNSRLRLSLQFSLEKIGDCLSQIKINSIKIFDDLKLSRNEKSMLFLSRANYNWKGISITRNIIIHQYHIVNNHIIYESLKNDIPELIDALNYLENQPEIKPHLDDALKFAEAIVFYPEKLEAQNNNDNQENQENFTAPS